jgi:HK97 family phage major capsid protein
MTNELADRQQNALHLLRQTLDEEVSPLRTDLDGLRTAGTETKQAVERLTQEVLALQQKNKELQLALNRPNVGGYDDDTEKKKRAREGRAAYTKALLTGGVGRLSPEERKYIKLDYEVGIASGESLGHGQSDEYKTMYASLAQTGGFLMTPEVAAELIESIVLMSDMRSLVNVRTTSKPWVSIRKRTQTSSATRIAEQATRTETQNPAFGLVQVFPYESYALSIISRQDLDDSDLNLPAYINSDFGQQFAVLVGREILTGGGAGKGECNGILNNTSITGAATTSATSLVLAYPDFPKLVYSMKTGYRKGASFIMATETFGNLLGITDTQQRPLIPAWQGMPPTILGYPVSEMPDMPQIGANNYAVAFGNWKLGYEFVERNQMSVQTLVELYANQSAVGYMAYYRFGGDVKLPEAIKLLKVKP